VAEVRAGVAGQAAAVAGAREPEVADDAHVADDKADDTGDDIPARGGRDQPSVQHAGPAGATGPAAPAGPATPEHAGPASPATPEHAGPASPASPTGRAEDARNGGPAAHHDPAEQAGAGLADERDDARPAGADATGDGPAAAGSGDQPAQAPAIGLTADVTVVPGVARYHRSDCILIRFLGPDDLEILTRQAAEAAGCVPCRACVPDKPSADA
jgi:hypothetical protein